MIFMIDLLSYRHCSCKEQTRYVRHKYYLTLVRHLDEYVFLPSFNV